MKRALVDFGNRCWGWAPNTPIPARLIRRAIRGDFAREAAIQLERARRIPTMHSAAGK